MRDPVPAQKRPENQDISVRRYHVLPGGYRVPIPGGPADPQILETPAMTVVKQAESVPTPVAVPEPALVADAPVVEESPVVGEEPLVVEDAVEEKPAPKKRGRPRKKVEAPPEEAPE